MSVERSEYGRLSDGSVMHAFTLSNENGMKALVSDYGADLLELWVPDKDGKLRNVVLTHKDAAGYEDNGPAFGATVGRHANRIAGASFELNGKTYELAKNDGPNNLHSKPGSYYQRFWDAEEGEDENGSSVVFSLVSPDGDQNYPGTLQVDVTYTLTPDNSLVIRYHMISDQDTIANMTNHSYFNMGGHESGSILNQYVTIYADAYTPSTPELIPTGEIAPVEGTPFDFREEKKLGRDIAADNEQIKNGGGFDHNFVLTPREDVQPAAKMRSEESGICMTVYTDLPGMQLYTANTTSLTGKDGAKYEPFCGACFETQFFPDSIHHANFPSCILKAEQEFETSTVFHFEIR